MSIRLAAILAMLLLSGARAACAAEAPGFVSAADAAELRRGNASDPGDRMRWFRSARFGLFIHWGVYAVPAKRGEWQMHNEKIPVATYRSLAKDFNPVRYDPDAWVALAKAAGMKYVIITAKHHEGFALYPSDVTDWDIADATPYGRDLLGPLVAAAYREGLKIGCYYSQAQDWVHRGGAKKFYAEGDGWDEAQKGSFDAYLRTIALPQVRELMTRYPLDVFWWDTPEWMTPERAAPFQDAMKLRPGLLTNNRLGGSVRGDFSTPEQHIPVTGIEGDWETCMTIGSNWGFATNDTKLKSTEELIRKLAQIAGQGGNFLLNVGPRADGAIPEGMAERLRGIGAWLRTNGESIYDTSAGPFAHLSWGTATLRPRSGQARSGNRLYLHVLDWPREGGLRVPLQNAAGQARLLAAPDRALLVQAETNRLTIELPATAPDPADSVVVLDLEREPVPLPPPTVGARVTASASQSNMPPRYVLDGTEGRKWRAPVDVKTAWIEIALAAPATLAGFAFDEPRNWPRYKQAYTLAVPDGAGWRTIATGRTAGHGAEQNFPPVTTARVRLTLTLDVGAPGVTELKLHRAE